MAASRILVIDDDPATAQVVGGLFPDYVCQVDQTSAGATGLERAREHRPVLVVLSADIDAGYACCRHFKKDPDLSSLPIVLVSASATPEQFRDHQKLSTRADAYLHKPLDEGHLAAIVIDLIGSDRTAPDPPPREPAHPTEVPQDPPTSEESIHGDDLPAVDSVTPAAPEETTTGEVAIRPEDDAVLVEALTRERDGLVQQMDNLRLAHERSEQIYEIERTGLNDKMVALQDRCEALETQLSSHPVEELMERIEEQADQIASLRAEIQRLKAVRKDLEHTLAQAIASVAQLPTDSE